MILRKSALIPILLAHTANAYFAQANNAHVEFAATGGVGGTIDDTTSSDTETVDASHIMIHAALENALQKYSKLGDYAAPKILVLFEEWIQKFGKEYDSLEKSERMLVWLENHVLIETHNAKESSFTLGHNDFSDMTHAEFRQRMGLGEFAPELVMREGKQFNFMEFNEEEANEEEVEISNSRLRSGQAQASPSAVQRKLLQAQPSSPATATDADEADWHTQGLMGPIRNQGICGACWAFSAIGSIESAMAIDKYNAMTPVEQAQLVISESGLGLVEPLSEQNLIDCDTLHEKGCKGGLMTTTFEEEEVHKGICSEIDYPYLQTPGTCSSDLCTPVPGSIVKDHVDIVPRRNNALKEALKVKPVTAAMVATDPTFQFYKNGIYQVESCGKVTKTMGQPGCNMLYMGQDVCLPDINHGVLVVGYGKDESATTDIKTFFKVKNSWGDVWGEGGYFRLARGETDKTDPMSNWGECAILTMLSYPVME
eukprot:CAMPEP_0172306044 /NCGR_PEP_ID=MMETSP1058-20130122/7197_1 /TAXON_ID=83371 /ORGANISM="Detonula confervacea, Strain CCMP 353" /LENGTH=483 /DNA_ID=CAMNT_0013017815 /DNA_START=87 /DNA_END=1538 /DNA_ORIENTATION=+